MRELFGLREDAPPQEQPAAELAEVHDLRRHRDQWQFPVVDLQRHNLERFRKGHRCLILGAKLRGVHLRSSAVRCPQFLGRLGVDSLQRHFVERVRESHHIDCLATELHNR